MTDPSSPSPRLPRPVKALAALVGATVAALVLAEVGLRASGYRPSYASSFQAFHENDPVLGYRGKKNYSARFQRPNFDVLITHDDQGFRKLEHPNETGAHTLVVLGDSYVWGWGVAQGKTLTDALGPLLPDQRVLNRGINGAGTVVEYQLFHDQIEPKLAAGDTVVLCFVSNDFWDNIKSDRLHADVKDGTFTIVPPNEPCIDKDNPLDASYVGNWLRAAWNLRKLRNARHDELDHAIKLGKDDAMFKIAAHYLVAMKDACAAKKARFLVAYVPGPMELGEGAGGAVDLEQDRAYRAAVEEIVSTNQLEMLDLLPSFLEAKKADAALLLTYPNDGHWTEAGHALVAKLVAARLKG